MLDNSGLDDYWADNGTAYLEPLTGQLGLSGRALAELRRRAFGAKIGAGVRAPVVPPRGYPVPVILSRLAPTGQWPDYLSPESKESISSAQRQAYLDMDLPLVGERPLRLPALEALAPFLGLIRIQGPSLYAAAYLETVAHASGLGVVEKVVATGAPKHLATGLAEKSGVVNAGVFYYLGGPVEGVPGYCASAKELARQVWGYFPGPGGLAPLVRMGTPGKVSLLSTLDAQVISWPEDKILAEQVASICARSVAELKKVGSRLRLQVVGPVMMAAALGWHLKNMPEEVILVDRDLKPLWSSKIKTFLPVADPALGDATGHFYIGPTGSSPQEGFQMIQTPRFLEHQLTGQLVRAILDQLSPYRRLRIAILGPQVLGFSLALALKNVREVAFLHHDPARGYEIWPFE